MTKGQGGQAAEARSQEADEHRPERGACDHKPERQAGHRVGPGHLDSKERAAGPTRCQARAGQPGHQGKASEAELRYAAWQET